MMQGIRNPDLIFYLRPKEVVEMSERADFGKERYESVQVQSQVTKNFDEIFAGNLNVHQIDSTQSIEAIAQLIASIISIKLIG